jgi:hypothetical protein
MSTRRHRRARPRLERLEARLAMSLPPSANTYGLTPPANTIGLSLGDATRPGSPSATTVTISPQNITPGKPSTEFGVFVRPYGNSGLVPKIVGVEEDGKGLPAQHGRVFGPHQAGSSSDQSVVFFETGRPGTVTILVSGRGLSTGQYTVETTLVGDVNGDGQVNLADVQPFANAYVESEGQAGYSAAADYNQNGIVNLYDALALERNMPISSKPREGLVAINLAPQDEIHYSGPKNSGGITSKKDVTIDGYTTPGSVVLVDSTGGDYTFGSLALPTNASGFFTVKAINTQGVNTYNFKIVDPFGHQYIRSFPVYWTTYAEPNSPYHYKPSKKTTGGGRINGAKGPAGGATTGGPGSSGLGVTTGGGGTTGQGGNTTGT